MTIWALFDSETCGVAKALPEHEVYSFGIGGSTEHIHLDLSDFEAAKTELDRYPKPDAIFASPPCESWVSVSIGNKRHFTTEKGLNLFWKNKWTAFDFRPKHKETRENGCRTALCLAQIIQHYKPEFWAIENGKSSLIFDYMENHFGFCGKRNICKYYSYGFDVLKPTIIYSNKILSLKQFNPQPWKLLQSITDHDTEERRILKKKQLGLGGIKKDYKTRSLVPPLLYKDIMRQFIAAKEEE